MVSFIIGNECWASARFANCITSYEISAATDVDSRSNPLALSMQTAKACTRKLDLMEFLCSRMYTVRTHCIRHFNRNILSSLIALRADGATTAHRQHSELTNFCANLHVCVCLCERLASQPILPIVWTRPEKPTEIFLVLTTFTFDTN